MSGAHQAKNMGNGSPHAGYPEPSSFAFDEESEAEIRRILSKYPAGRQASSVTGLLWLVQQQMYRETGSSWVPRVAMDVVAERLEMPPIRVYEIATFYSMYNTAPTGRYHLQVCTTTPCWLRGSDEVVAACKRVTGISAVGGTSEDGLFTISEVECLGACVNAPVLQINDNFYEDVDGPLTEELLAKLKRGEALPPPGSMTGRQTSAPDGGSTTLTTVTE